MLRTLATLSLVLWPLATLGCDAGSAEGTQASSAGSAGACSSDMGCSSGHGCVGGSGSSENVCRNNGGTWLTLTSQGDCEDAGESWRALTNENDCVEAGFEWNSGQGSSSASQGGSACAPNLQQTCPCGGGVEGVQACLADGSGWTPCDCGGEAPAEPDTPTTLVGEACESNGEQACDGERAVVTCSGGSWLETEDCGEGRCEAGVCLGSCSAECSGRACGDDGCGGSCGSCEPGESCDNISGQCIDSTSQCVPNASKECVDVDGTTAIYWYDSCGEQGAWIETCQGEDYCADGGCVEACQYHAAKRCKGDNIYWYDSCGQEESPFKTCEPYEYCIHQGDVEAACLKGVYAGQWMVKAVPSDPTFYDNVFTLTEDSDANTVTFEELIPGYGKTYYTGELDGKLLIAEGSYESGGVVYETAIQITFSVPPDTNGVAPTSFTGFWATNPTMEGMSLGNFVTNIEGTKQ